MYRNNILLITARCNQSSKEYNGSFFCWHFTLRAHVVFAWAAIEQTRVKRSLCTCRLLQQYIKAIWTPIEQTDWQPTVRLRYFRTCRRRYSALALNYGVLQVGSTFDESQENTPTVWRARGSGWTTRGLAIVCEAPIQKRTPEDDRREPFRARNEARCYT